MSRAQQNITQATGFGRRYAILNLDLMTILVDIAKESLVGQKFISNCTLWNDAVHQKDTRPLTIFTTLYFCSNTRPDLVEGAPFTKLVEAVGAFEEGSPGVQIASNFTTDEKDHILQKTRWYAGSSNNLEEILRTHNINTVVISGMALSGVVMSTVYRLFDLDYHIYVISDNVVELPLEDHAAVSRVLLNNLLGKMNLSLISLDQALKMLEKS